MRGSIHVCELRESSVPNRSLILILLAMMTLSGCAQIANGINQINAALTSPAANQAVANLKAGSQALLCGVANVSAVAGSVEAAVRSGQAIVRDTQDIYVVSGTLCYALGGSIIAAVTVPAGVK